MTTGKRKLKVDDLVLRLEKNGETIREEYVSNIEFPFQIGRKTLTGWVIPADDKSASSLHAEVYIKGGRLRIKDLKSRNGIFVMGERVEDVKLEPGMQVNIGHCHLIIERDPRKKDGAGTARPRLEQLTGRDSGKVYELVRPVTPIGSGVGAGGILCASLLVSKHHAEISRKHPDEACWLKDLGSRNGTLVNGVPLKDNERMLRDGDLISFADYEFKFMDSEQIRPHVWKKVAVALLTAAFCLTGYFVWQSIWPSAKSILATELEYERAGQFDAAVALLEKVCDARGGDNYRDEVNKRKANIAIWRETIKQWHEVQRLLPERKWIASSEGLGTLLSRNVERWGWNATSAQKQKKRAAFCKNALDVFLSARTALAGGFIAEEIGRERDSLERHLNRMESVLAMEDWSSLNILDKLHGDMIEQCDAVKAIISDLKGIEAIVDEIKSPEGHDLEEAIGMLLNFESLVQRLERIRSKSLEREKSRAQAASDAKRRYVSSDIVVRKCDTYLPVLRKFIESRMSLENNCDLIVSLKDEGLIEDIPFPSDRDCSILPQFGDIRIALAKANERLLKLHRGTVNDQLNRLAAFNIGNGKLPAQIASLKDMKLMQRVFSCDTLVPSSPPPAATRNIRVGAYDEVLGMEEFAEFLISLDQTVKMPYTDDVSRPEPLISQTLRLYGQLERFEKSCTSVDIRYLARRTPASGNCLEKALSAATELRSARRLLVDVWWNWRCKDIRSRIISKGAALALDGGEKLGEKDVEKLKSVIDEWRREINSLDRMIRENPMCVDEVRPKILAIAIPGLSAGRASRHWNDEAAKMNGGGE